MTSAEYIDLGMMPLYAFSALAALVLTIVLAVILIVSKKEKRRQMKKIKIAVCISAVLIPVMITATIFSSQDVIICVLPVMEDIELPDLTGMGYKECKTAYSNLFDLSVESMEYSSEYPEGAIISQRPKSGIYQNRADSDYKLTVQCVVSAGPRMVTVPNMIGIDFETAEEICESVGIILEIESEEYSDEYQAGTVISASPERNEKTEFGGTVKCIISKGKESDISE